MTTWSLTNFELLRAPCHADVFVAKSSPVLPDVFRFWGPPAPPRTDTSSVVHLPDRIEPVERRNALWLAHALLFECRPPTGSADGDMNPQPVKRKVFPSQTPAGLVSLATRMQQLPYEYRIRNCVDWESVLVPPASETVTNCAGALPRVPG